MELAVRDSSHMEEIELSNRNTNMFDGAKLKRKRSIDGCDIPRKGNMMLQDKQIADSNTNSDIDINIDWAGGGYLITNLDNLKLVCSDGVSIEAKPFKRESGVVNGFYNNKFGIPIFESDSKTLEMVKEFCVARAYFQDYYAYHYPDSHEESLQKALNWCNSKFLEQYQSNFQATIKIIEAAFELEMISLIHLMMEAVIDLFSDMNEGDVYDFFPVHLINKDDDYEFEEMKSTLSVYRCYFSNKCKDKCTCWFGTEPANYNWDPELLKQTFHCLKDDRTQQRRWLIAHFLLRRPYLADYYGRKYKESKYKECANEDEKR